MRQLILKVSPAGFAAALRLELNGRLDLHGMRTGDTSFPFEDEDHDDLHNNFRLRRQADASVFCLLENTQRRSSVLDAGVRLAGF